ncbi:MAG TPA: flagellar basal-body MS-ring/collar protein FliF [Chthonomonadaceae bacterium]|nr:flagellar basal-body MS-ring/collar protein FliF [Chthonomonadaceae bacterium]
MIHRAREVWDGLGRNNQIILALSSLGALIALIGFIAWASTPEYVPLFSNLSAQDANAISDKLREANVPFRYQQGGTAIEVPAQSRDEMRMKIMSQGLPAQSSATLGYELLEKGGTLGQTATMEATTLLRAKEGEIGKSIMSLQQVASATVHVAPADDSPFASDKHPPSASVLVQLKPGQSLSEENVRAIVRLTQMSYTGLSEKNISVVNGQGDLLYDGTRSGDGSLAEDRMKQQTQLAMKKRSELQSALDSTIGPRKAVVLVNVELNSDQEEIKTDTVDPGAVTQKTSETEELKGAGSVGGAAAAPGTNANVTANPPLAGGNAPGVPNYAKTTGSDGNYKHEITTTQTEPSRTVKHTIKAPGRIEKMTVSALVDTKVPADQVASIQQILSTAIGATPGDPTRQVSIAQIAFDRSGEKQEKEAQAAAQSAENMKSLISLAVPLGIMFVTFMLLARALRKTKRADEGPLVLAGAGAGGGSLGFRMADGNALVEGPDGTMVPRSSLSPEMLDEDGEPIGLPTGSGGPKTYDVIEEAFDAHLESIVHLTRSKPETVAALIRSWIAEEQM